MPQGKCSAPGCKKWAYRKGVCVSHGAKVKQCSKKGCTNQAYKGGLCIRHGAKVKQCRSEGCTNFAKTGGVCIRHGAKVKQCRKEGCTNYAQQGGVCIRHGAKHKRCSHDGCTNQVQRKGLCRRHGAYKHTSPDEANQQGDEINPPLPPLPAIELRDEAPKPKRPRTSVQLSKRTRTTSLQNRQANASVMRSPRVVASKRKAARANAAGVDQDTSTKRRRKSNIAHDAAETLLSFATTSKTGDAGESTYYDEDNVDSFQLDDSTTVGTEPQDLAVKVSLESLPAVIWDDSSLSSSPSISKFLTIEEVNNVRLVSKALHRHNPSKRAKLRVNAFKSTRPFLKRAMKFLGPAKELFNRPQVEIMGSSLITRCRNFFRDKTGMTQGFFSYTNCLSRVKGLTLVRPDDYTILQSLGDLSSLERLCIRNCFPFHHMTRPCKMYLKSSNNYGNALKNVGYIELTKCSLPRLLLKDLFQSATKLKRLKIRRCQDEDTSCVDFFDALSKLRGLEEFKFVPGYLIEPSATVAPTDDDVTRAGLELISLDEVARDGVEHSFEDVDDLLRGDADAAREDLELVLQNEDEFTRLSARMLVSVCNTQNEGLKSLSMRNVELLGGVGIEPLRRLRCIEKLCLCALTSFEGYHLKLLHDVGKDTLRKLSLVHCQLIEGHLGPLTGMTQLEELSLLATTLCDDDIESLSTMKRLKVLNVFGQIQYECNLSQLRPSGNLHHLSLQIYNKVSRDVAQQLNGMVSLESLCLRMRFMGVHEMDTNENVPFIPVDVDEESTLNLSVGMRTDASVMDETIMDDDETLENALMVESPLDFSGLHNLRSLFIYDSVLTDDLVESISGLHQLRELSLWDCHALSEESISHLSTMQSLEKLCLHRFDAMSVASLETLSSTLDSIKELEFYQCGIMRDVEIDNNLGLMKRLRKLTISPYHLEKPIHLTHLQLVKDDSERKTKKRVAHLLRKIRNRGLF
eukprot:scaffold13923_cov78-Skeletonema_dohrnii-CCMP3373.AAC.1